MYTQFFGLREKPFAITPDPQYLYLSYRHGEALAHLLYGLTESGGFIQLTGEVGTGKTLLTRTLLERLPSDVDVALILNPRLSAQEFLEAIFDELHLKIPVAASIKQMVDELNDFLLDAHARGRRVVLLVDEAQNLDSEVLEQLRLLTNLETAKQKLLQIILVGQPELRDTLARNDLRQLAQRITGRYHLGNLSRDETRAYIEHRMGVAGAERPIFQRGAIAAVYRASGGVPRLINIICDRALLGAYTTESPLVTRRLVRRAAAEVSGDTRGSVHLANWLPEATLAAGVLGVAGVALWFVAQHSGSDATAALAAATGSEPAQAAARRSLSPLPSPTPPAELDIPAPTIAEPGPEVVHHQIPLIELLASAGNLTGTDAAMRGLAGLWGAELEAGSIPPCDQVRTHNLKCEFQVGSWTLLEQLDRPAILSLVAPGGETHQVVVAGIDGDTTRLLIGDRSVVVPTGQVRELWFGRSLLLWQPNPLADALMGPGTRSEGVAWLRSQLEQMQGGDRVSSNLYDPTLTERVRRFQREANLEADGIAGIHTLIALNNRLDGHRAPRLRSAD